MSDPPFRTIEFSDPRFESDGLRLVTVKSAALGGRADVSIFVPSGLPADGEAVPLVTLLHGVYGSHWAWALKAGAHRTAQRLFDEGRIPAMVLAMPSDGLWGDGSGYVKHTLGGDFERWIVDEVPQLAMMAAPVVTEASSRFLAGLSMGGFGALRIGAKHGLRYRGVSGHSSVTELAQLREFSDELIEGVVDQAADRSVLETIRKHRAALPRMRFDCGRDDSLLVANRELHAALEAEGIAHVYDEFEGGHEWVYWEAHLVDTLLFFADCLRTA